MKLMLKSAPFILLATVFIGYVLFTKDNKNLFTLNRIPPELMVKEPEWDISKVDAKYNSSVRQLFYNMVPRCGSKAMLFLVLHQSKTQGFSTTKAFDQKYITSNYHISINSIQNIAYGLRGLKEPWIFTKILNYINFTNHGPNLNPVYINIVRDPIERLEAHYYFRREGDITKGIINYHGQVASDFFKDADDKDAKRRRNMTFDECVLTFDPECTDVRFTWTIIPHFCGQHYLCQTPTRNALNLAIKNVLTEFAVVGYTEKYIELLEVLETLFPHFFKGAIEAHWYLQKSRPKYTKDVQFHTSMISVDTREALMRNKMIKLEYEFYDFIIKRFKIVYEAYTGHNLS